MKGENLKSTPPDATLDSIRIRLDALILILLETHFKDDKDKLNLGLSAKLLHTAGLTPSEIAAILGKKSRTEVAQYLYPKKK